MNSGGGGTTTQTIQNADPWVGAQPFLGSIMGQAAANFTGGLGQTYFPDSTVVPFSGQTQDALGQMEARARAGSPLTPAAQGAGLGILGQNFADTGYGATFNRLMDPANSNMATQGLLDRVTGDVTDAVNAEFSAAGRYGSGKHHEGLARGITEGTAPILFNQFNQDRAAQLAAGQAASSAQSDLFGRQIQAAALSPQLAAMDYTDPAQLAQVGAAREGKEGEYLQDRMARHEFAQMQPWNLLRDYYAPIVHGTAGLGGTTTGTQTMPNQSGGVGGALGSAMGGAMTGSMFGPWGTAIGGGLGLLSGIF